MVTAPYRNNLRIYLVRETTCGYTSSGKQPADIPRQCEKSADMSHSCDIVTDTILSVKNQAMIVPSQIKTQEEENVNI